MAPPLLDIRDLQLVIGATPILRGVSLQLEAGAVQGLVGESGAGKSMIGRAVLGLLPPGARVSTGTVRFAGRDLLNLPERELQQLRGRDISLIPQNPMTALNPVARIEPQLTDVVRMHLGIDAKAARARALQLLNEVHLREPERVLRQYPHQLSGGMRQRVCIAIAFACNPKLVIADEPTTALDVTVQKQILRLIREMQTVHHTAVLFISHDLGVVAKACGEVSVLHAGRVLEHNSTEALFAQPQHEYTRALLAATPRYDRPGEALQPLPVELNERLWRDALRYDQVSRNSSLTARSPDAMK
jgi:peptide/nickel transport system ATP-binding protein